MKDTPATSGGCWIYNHRLRPITLLKSEPVGYKRGGLLYVHVPLGVDEGADLGKITFWRRKVVFDDNERYVWSLNTYKYIDRLPQRLSTCQERTIYANAGPELLSAVQKALEGVMK